MITRKSRRPALGLRPAARSAASVSVAARIFLLRPSRIDEEFLGFRYNLPVSPPSPQGRPSLRAGRRVRMAFKNPKVDLNDISLDELKHTFHLPMKEASQVLGICLSGVKKLCRKYDIPRWPHRKVRS